MRHYRVYLLAAMLVISIAVVARPWFDDTRPIQVFMDRHDLVGVSLAYGEAGSEPTVVGIGQPEDAVLPYYSLSKPLTATAIVRAVRQEALALVDDVEGATLRQLLQHTAGWDNATSFDPVFDKARNTDCTQINPPERQFEPGTRYAYSNLGYCIAGRHLGDSIGETYPTAVRRLIPAARRMTYDAQLGPAGGWSGTARQFWMVASAPIDPLITTGTILRPDDTPYGLGWGVDAGGQLSHFGWRTDRNNFAAVLRDDDFVAVALFSGLPNDPERAKRELRSVLSRLSNSP